MGCCNSRFRGSRKASAILHDNFDHSDFDDCENGSAINPSQQLSTMESVDNSSVGSEFNPQSSPIGSAVLTDEALLLLLASFADEASLGSLARVSRRFNDAVLLHEALAIDTCDAIGRPEVSEGPSCWLDLPQTLLFRRHSMQTLMELHHSQPLLTCLCLPKMSSPNCVPLVACFSALRHVSLGCLQVSHSTAQVTDRDIQYLAHTCGPRLLSVHLIKLQGISYRSLASLSYHCTCLRSVVLFGCGRVRGSIGQFPPDSPPLILPLPVEQCRGVSPPSQRLLLMDLRYSLDLTDALLTQIKERFVGILL